MDRRSNRPGKANLRNMPNTRSTRGRWQVPPKRDRLHQGQDGRIGPRDQQIDRGMIEAAQQPFRGRDRPHVERSRNPEHADQAAHVDQAWAPTSTGRRSGSDDHNGNGAHEAQDDSGRMHDAVGNDLGAIVVPADLSRAHLRRGKKAILWHLFKPEQGEHLSADAISSLLVRYAHGRSLGADKVSNIRAA